MKSTHPVWVVLIAYDVVVGVYASEDLAKEAVKFLIEFGDSSKHYEYRKADYYS